jgi:hypothetical protein
VPYAGSQSATMTVNALGFVDFFRQYLLRPALVALVGVAWTSLRRRRLLASAVAAFCAVVLFTYLPFKLDMNFSHRFLAPLYPLAILGVGEAVKGSDSKLKLVLVVTLLVIPQIRMNVGGMAHEKEYTSTYKRLMDEEHVALGERLRTTLSPDGWLVVYADAGAIPYYSGLRTVDFGRLNDEYLTTHRRSETEVADYFFSRNPAALVVTMESRASPSAAGELRAILSDPRIGSYTLEKIYGSNVRTGYSEVLYVRNDLLHN